MERVNQRLNQVIAEFKPFGATLSKEFVRAQQLAKEKMGTETDVTVLPAEYLELENKVDKIKNLHENFLKISYTYTKEHNDYILTTADSVLDFATIVQQQVRGYLPRATPPLTSDIPKSLSHAFSKIAYYCSFFFGAEEPMSIALKKFSKGQEEIGSAKATQDQEATNKFHEPYLSTLTHAIGNSLKARKNVHSVRLTYDAKRVALKNAKPEFAEAAKADMELAEDEFVQAVDVSMGLMKAVVESNEPLKNLADLVSAQLKYHKKAYEVLQNLSPDLDELIIQQDINLYQLKYRREFLDLSLSVRFANLPPGAKLVLVQGRSKSAAPSQVSIALQLDEGGRLMGKFSSDTVLWEILKFFESTNSSLNLTTRSEIPTQKNNTLFKKFTESGKKKFYQMPVCVFMNKEYNTIPILKQTSLRDAGLTSGNGVIRVLLKCTDKTLEEILSEIETVSKGDDTSTATEIFVKPDRVSSLVELNENSSANPDVSKNFSNSEVSEEDPTRKQNIEIPNSLGNTEVAIDDADKVTSMDVDSVSITTDNPSNVPKMMETGDGVSNNKSLESSKSIDKPNYLEKFKEVEDTPMDITNPEKDSNENLLPFDREIKVYKALPANVKAAKGKLFFN
ncbi:hypothetical protein HK099_006441 [Clydaea vesicula]|uniref:BAR domain-containing protein n=1 Tax=Clydaea vesicula TaxID=447962 RepID=A0AAD5U163_9FUNG|nr:hypothetical protein HK099_006441 [Clydaea vesicula]